MSKRPSLAESMKQAIAPAPTTAAVVTAPPVAPVPADEPAARPQGFYAATRAGKKKVTAALSPAAHKQLKGLAVERESTTEALLGEAINDLFIKYGKPPMSVPSSRV